MTLDELRIRIRQICEEAASEQTWLRYDKEKRDIARKKLDQLFSEHRSEVFELANRVPSNWSADMSEEERETWNDYFRKWSLFEKEIAEGLPVEYHMIRRRAIAFFTCSCGSRVDSCPEDGDGNFSTFVFMPEGDIFRIMEKKQ